MSEAQILRTVLDRWKSAVDAHEPDRVASYFTEDAIFQACTRTPSAVPGLPRTTPPSRSA